MGGGAARTTRRATAADIPSMRAIFRAHGGDSPPVPGGADVTGPCLEAHSHPWMPTPSPA